jgi:two-component system sensor histidine kinase ComP
MVQLIQRHIIGRKWFKAGNGFPAFCKGEKINPMTKRNMSSLLPILFVIGITLYSIVIILKYPLIGIEVKEQNNQFIIESIYEKGWSKNQPINEGDILKLVDGKNPKEHSTVNLFYRVEKAKDITIEGKDSKITTYDISNDDLENQYLIYLFFPLLFIFTTIGFSIFLYLKKKEDKSAIILIYFLLSLGTCYLSASLSTRGDVLGRILTIVTLPGSILLFMHFLKMYFNSYHLAFIRTRVLHILYILCLGFILLMAVLFIFNGFYSILNLVQLVLYVILIVSLLFHLVLFYVKNKDSEGKGVLRILWFGLFLALGPFLFLYAIPVILFDKELISAEVTSIFLIIIPIVFFYLQFADKLFDIDFLLGRIRFYSLLSLPFTILIVLVLRLFFHIKILSSAGFLFSLLLFMGIVVFLFLKEYLDYRIGHHLFSKVGNFDNSLYKFFQKAMDETKVDSLINNLINEIRNVLMVKDVAYLEIGSSDKNGCWEIKNKDEQPWAYEDIETINWSHYKIGNLIELKAGFLIIIGGDYERKYVIFCGLKKFKTNLNIQEKIWLETIAYISSILLENYQLIEDLVHKIEHYKEEIQEKDNWYPSWLSRLIFTLSEKERANLSIDLHDSVLQDLLQILREIDSIIEKVNEQTVKDDLFELKERILDNIHLVRDTCNELRPPFLKELGLLESLQHLFEQTKLRSSFLLHTNLDSNLHLREKEYELTLYRVIQELLNNAMKHSKATDVKLSLTQQNNTLIVEYEDNGIGMDITQLQDSFKTIGLAGIKERVKSISGKVHIFTSPGNGMNVLIEIITGGNYE